MANKIISFTSSDENYIDSDLSSSQVRVEPVQKYADISMESDSSTESYDKSNHWKIAKNVNLKAIFKALDNIFSWIPGERILLPEFGSRLRYLLYEGITPLTEERIAAEIRSSVSEWEPRISIADIRDVSTASDTEDNTIHLEVVFTVPSMSDEQYAYDFSYTRSN